MTAWAVHGIELPFGDETVSRWIDPSGAVHDRPVSAADLLPGRFFVPGLVDAHAHPAVGSGPAGLMALDASAARATLAAWAQAGITLVRDVGSPRGLTLQLRPGPGLPAVQAAGRFLAPAGRYFPDLSSRVRPRGDPTSRTRVIPACAQAVRFARAALASSATRPAGPAPTAGWA